MRIQKAHLCMLAERGVISQDVGRTLHDRLEWMTRNWQPPEQYPAHEAAEDLYFVLEQELARLEGEESAAWLHTARSRNDMDTTAFRMALREALIGLCRNMLDVWDRIEDRARKGADELTVLYTHGQPANPSTTEHYLTALLLDFAEDIEVLQKAIECVDSSTMGACAITGTGFSIDRQRVAELLGFSAVDLHTYRAIAGSHWLVAPAQAVQRIMLDIGRFIADLLHKSSAEVGLYSFNDDLVQISSIMPQKRNPVILEHIRIQAGQVAGCCNSIVGSFMNVPYQDVNENADALVSQFMDSMPLAGSVLDLLCAALEGMCANSERAEEICRAYGVTTTELADTLVRKKKIGFRAAHGICAVFAKSGGNLDVLRRAWQERSGEGLSWDDEEISGILDPRHFVEVRTTPGGPAVEGMVPVYAMLKKRRDAIADWVRLVQKRLALADERLADAWKSLEQGEGQGDW